MDSSYDKFKKYFLYFMAYSVIGWLYEVILEVVIYRWGYSDRGVLTGPYCPVYGLGALIFIFTAYRLIRNKPNKKRILLIPLVFCICLISATLVELMASYICEFLTGTWQWQSYARYRYNYQARIALSPSIRFGIGGVFFLYILQPIFERISDKLSKKQLNIAFYIIGIIFLIDLISFIVLK